jgi:8-oxo-dGTP pyrophosphatase MutT (NUDIX family)
VNDSFEANQQNRTLSFCARVLAICPEDGKIILNRTPYNYFEFPGGNSNSDDRGNPARTAIRRFFEETNIHIENGGRLKMIARRQIENFGCTHVWICFQTTLSQSELDWYKPVSEVGKIMRLEPEEILAARKPFQRRNIGCLNKEQQHILEDYLSGRL